MGNISQYMERTLSTRPPAQQACEGVAFAVTLMSMGGETLVVSDLQPQAPLSELCKKAALVLGFEAYELQLCKGSRFFTQDELNKAMEVLEITDGTLLTFIRRQVVQLHDPGVSRYNKDYCCTVSRVTEVGWGVLRIEFSVVGNMSLGQLQNPAKSVLTFWENGLSLSKFPASHKYDYYDLKSRVTGSLTYEGVPMHGQVGFTYGTGGYRELILHLTPDETSASEIGQSC